MAGPCPEISTTDTAVTCGKVALTRWRPQAAETVIASVTARDTLQELCDVQVPASPSTNDAGSRDTHYFLLRNHPGQGRGTGTAPRPMTWRAA
jgi:hypothetical protein